jgi:hypothetical protein
LVDGPFQLVNGVEGSAAYHPCGDERKEALNQIEPRTAGGREVEIESFPFLGINQR